MEINTVSCHSKESAFQNSSVASVERHWKLYVNKEISEIIDSTPFQLHGSNLLSMKVEELKTAISSALWYLFFNTLPNSSVHVLYTTYKYAKTKQRIAEKTLKATKIPRRQISHQYLAFRLIFSILSLKSLYYLLQNNTWERPSRYK